MLSSNGRPLKVTALPGSDQSLLVTIISSLTEQKQITLTVAPANGDPDEPAEITVWEIFATNDVQHGRILIAQGASESGSMPAGRILIKYIVETGEAEMSRVA